MAVDLNIKINVEGDAKVVDALGGMKDGAEEARDSVSGLGDSVSGLGEEIEGVGGAAEGAGDSVSGLGDELGGVGGAAEEAGDSVSGLGDELEGIGGAAEEGSTEARSAIYNFGQSMQTVFFTMQNFKSAIHAIKDAYHATVGAAVDFDYQIREILTLTGYSVEVHKQLSSEVKELAFTYGMNKQNLAKAYYQAISSGAVTAADGMELLEIASKLAVGGVTDVHTTIDGLTSIINAYSLTLGDTLRVSDAMFIAMKDGKTTIEELSRNIGLAAPHAAALGMEFDDLLALTSAMTTGGITTSYALNQIKMMLINMVKPTMRLEEVLDKAGITSVETAMRSEGLVATLSRVSLAAAGVSKELVDQRAAMGDTSEELRLFAIESGATREEIQALFGSVQGGAAVVATLSETIGTRYRNSLAEMRDETREMGAVSEEAFGIMADSAKFAIQSMYQGTKVLLTSVFEPLVISTSSLVNVVNSALGAIIDAVDKHKYTVTAVVLSIEDGVRKAITLMLPLFEGVVAILSETVAALIVAFNAARAFIDILLHLIQPLMGAEGGTKVLRDALQSLGVALEMLAPFLGHLIATFIIYRTTLLSVTLAKAAYTLATKRLATAINGSLIVALNRLITTKAIALAGITAIIGGMYLLHGDIEKMSTSMAKAKTVLYTYIAAIEKVMVEIYIVFTRIKDATVGVLQAYYSYVGDMLTWAAKKVNDFLNWLLEAMSPIINLLPAKFQRAIKDMSSIIDEGITKLGEYSKSLGTASKASLEAAFVSNEEHKVRRALLDEIDRELTSRHETFAALKRERDGFAVNTLAIEDIIEAKEKAAAATAKVEDEVDSHTKAEIKNTEAIEDAIKAIKDKILACEEVNEEEEKYQESLQKTREEIARLQREAMGLERGFRLIDADRELQALATVHGREKMALLLMEKERLESLGKVEEASLLMEKLRAEHIRMNVIEADKERLRLIQEQEELMEKAHKEEIARQELEAKLKRLNIEEIKQLTLQIASDIYSVIGSAFDMLPAPIRRVADVAKGVGGAILKVFEGVVDKLKGHVSKAFTAVFNMLPDWMLDAAKKGLQGISKLIQGLSKIITLAVEGGFAAASLSKYILDGIMEGLRKANQAAKAVYNFGASIAEGAVSVMSNAWEGLRSAGEFVASAITSSISNILSFAGGGGFDSIGGKADQITGVTDSLAKGFEKVSESLSISSYEFQNNLTGTLNTIANETPQILRNIKTELPNIMRGISNALPTIAKSFTDIATSFVTVIIEELPYMIHSFMSQLPDIIETLTNILPRIIEFIPHIINSFALHIPKLIDTIVDSMPVIIESLTRELPKVFDSLAFIAEELIHGIADILPTILDSLPSVVDSLVSQLPRVISAITDRTPEIIERLAVAFQEIVPMLGEAVREVIKGLVDMLPSLMEGISTGLIAVFNEIPSIVDALVEAAPVFMEGLREELPNILEALSEAAVSLVGGVVNILPEIASAIPVIVDSVMEELPKIIEALVDAVPVIIEVITENLPTLIDGFVALALALVDAIGDNLPALIDAALEIVQELIDRLPEIINALIAMLPQVVRGLAEMLRIVVPAIIRELPKIIEAILDEIPLIIDALMDIIVEIINAIPDIISSFLEALPSIISAIAERIPDIISAFVEALPQIFDAIATNLPAIIDAIVEVIPLIIEAIIENLPGIVDAVIKGLPPIIIAIIEAIPRIIMAFVAAIPDLIVAVIEEIPKIIEGIIKELPAVIAALFAAIFNLVRDIIGKIPEMLRKIIGAIGKLISGMLGGAIRSVVGLFSSAWDGLRNAGRAVADGIRGAWERTREAAGSAWDRTKDAVGNAWTRTRDTVKGWFGFHNGGLVGGREIAAGDNPVNDIVPAMLSAGEIVIPKSAVEGGLGSAIEFLRGVFNNPAANFNGVQMLNEGGVVGGAGSTGGDTSTEGGLLFSSTSEMMAFFNRIYEEILMEFNREFNRATVSQLHSLHDLLNKIFIEELRDTFKEGSRELTTRFLSDVITELTEAFYLGGEHLQNRVGSALEVGRRNLVESLQSTFRVVEVSLEDALLSSFRAGREWVSTGIITSFINGAELLVETLPPMFQELNEGLIYVFEGAFTELTYVTRDFLSDIKDVAGTFLSAMSSFADDFSSSMRGLVSAINSAASNMRSTAPSQAPSQPWTPPQPTRSSNGGIRNTFHLDPVSRGSDGVLTVDLSHRINPSATISGGMSATSSYSNSGFYAPMSNGGLVGGKEIIGSDSILNDVIPTMLSAGEMVIPKSFVSNGLEGIMQFASSILSKGKVEKYSRGGLVDGYDTNTSPIRSKPIAETPLRRYDKGDAPVQQHINVTLNIKTEKLDEAEIKRRIVPALQKALLQESKKGRRVIDPSGVRV